MASPDTWSTAMVLSGIAKNAGSFNAWDAASPFTSGSFSGYWRACNCAHGSVTYTKIWLYESSQGVVVRWETSTGGFLDVILTIGDPRPSSSSMRGVTCESDDKVYAMGVSASITGFNSTTMWTATALFTHSGSNGQCHFGYFQPGSSTWRTVTMLMVPVSAMTGTMMKSEGGEYIRRTIDFKRTAAAPNDTWAFELPGFYVYSDIGTHPSTQGPAGGSPTVYQMASSNTGTSDTFAIAAYGMS
jgi:hypothetical protein